MVPHKDQHHRTVHLGEVVGEQPQGGIRVVQPLSLIHILQSQTMDANIAGQSMTADRMAEVDMAGPYYYATIVCVTTKDSKFANAKSIADLAGGTDVYER